MKSDILDEKYKIKLSSRKLQSGKFQVKFFAEVDHRDVYGYLLVNQKETLKSVVDNIHAKLWEMSIDTHSQTHLFDLSSKGSDYSFMIFNNVHN